MQAHIEQLILVLNKELALYDQVLALMEEEHLCLEKRQPEDVLGIVRKKETLLLQIRTLDESRMLVCRRMARAWKLAPADLTLSDVVQRIEPPFRERLLLLKEQLRAAMDALKKANERSSNLCHRGLETIQAVFQGAARQEGGGRPQGGGKPYGGGGAGNGRLHCIT